MEKRCLNLMTFCAINENSFLKEAINILKLNVGTSSKKDQYKKLDSHYPYPSNPTVSLKMGQLCN